MPHLIEEAHHIAHSLLVVDIYRARRGPQGEIRDILTDVDDRLLVFVDPHQLLLRDMDIGHDDAVHLFVLQDIQKMDLLFHLAVGLADDNVVAQGRDDTVDPLKDSPEDIVRDVGKECADQLDGFSGGLLRGCVREISELPDLFQNFLSGLLRDRIALIHHSGHGRYRHVRGLRHLMDRYHSLPFCCADDFCDVDSLRVWL